MVKKRKYSRSRRFRKAFHRHAPKIVTKIINGIGLVGAFGPEITHSIDRIKGGTWELIPTEIIYRGTGFNGTNGSFDSDVLITSIGSKAGAFIWLKLAKFFVKHARI